MEPASQSSSYASSGVFVGRQRELAELRSALEESLAGRGQMIMLVGEPSIGKTRTAQELTSYAETQGARVLWGRCYEEEGAPPYWPWIQSIGSFINEQDPDQLSSAMGPGAAHIAELIPSLREKLPDLTDPPALEPEPARFRLFDSVTNFLKNASQTQPLVIVLDDLHWGDRASLLLLEFLARGMGWVFDFTMTAKPQGDATLVTRDQKITNFPIFMLPMKLMMPLIVKKFDKKMLNNLKADLEAGS